MSAPNTNIEKQAKRHAPSIWGITIALMIALLAALGAAVWYGYPSDRQAAPTIVEETQ